MKTKIFVLIALLFTLIASQVNLIKENKPTDEETFLVGIAANYAPWISINERGEYEGFDIDVIKAVAESMGKKLKLVDLGSMSSLFMALEQSKVDSIIWGISITPDRLKRMAMVRYQGDEVTSFPLLFWEKIPEGTKGFEDMGARKICVEPASSQETVMAKYPSLKPLFVDKVDDALLNLRYKKADAAFVEPAIAKKFKAKYPQLKSLDIPLAEENQVKGVGIGVKLKRESLTREIEQAVKRLEKKGIIEQFERKWEI